MILHKRVDESWLYGQVGEAKGMFPQSFIHILRPFDGEVCICMLDLKFYCKRPHSFYVLHWELGMLSIILAFMASLTR